MFAKAKKEFCKSKNYIKNLLERFGMTTCSDAKVPMACGTCLDPSLDKHAVNLKKYRNMIGSLLYLTTSRPDIMFLVFNCAKYQANQTEPHLIVVKNIFQYLHCTPTLGLWYPANTCFFIQEFSDTNLGFVS